ncbi:hypothetical protein [Streptomyces ziwulingensis]|uniref:hypothetical protein n=1 Tax=Streptomyces ziwulingensis TaxID=1045501 RepID=UPI0031E9B8AB
MDGTPILDGSPGEPGGAEERGRIDLSVPQVAGSALSAVIAAKLASSFGVYGTILGAGLISVVATCGGSVFQHFFKRTGEQLRVRRPAEQPRAGGRAAVAASGSWPSPPTGEFTPGTVYRARVRGWKRPLLAAALVFGVAMGGITAYELLSGHNLSGGGSTTVSNALSGHSASSSGTDGSDEDEPDGTGGSPDTSPSPAPGESGATGSGDDAPTAAPSGSPSTGASGVAPGSGSAAPDGPASGTTPAPSATDGGQASGDGATAGPGTSATAPAPSASDRSETGDQGPDGLEAP